MDLESTRGVFREWVFLYGHAALAQALGVNRQTVYSWVPAIPVAPSREHAQKMLALAASLPTGFRLTYEDIYGDPSAVSLPVPLRVHIQTRVVKSVKHPVQFCSLTESRKILDICSPTLHAWIRKGYLKPTKIHGHPMIPKSQLDAAINLRAPIVHFCGVQYFSQRACLARLGIGDSTLEGYIRDGRLRRTKIGPRYLIAESELERLQAERGRTRSSESELERLQAERGRTRSSECVR
jgi:excisionase family DNA binding protein